MIPDATVVPQFILPIGLLVGLVLGYGALRRHLPGTVAAQLVLGGLFGLVALVQMKLPISPVEGVIIDLRNIPIVLAGGFLGLRGMLVALTIACAVRLGIGGVGAMSGVGGMLISGTVGLAWDHVTRGSAQRSLVTVACLGLVSSAHIVAVVLLPQDIALWFLSHMAAGIAAMNLCIVTIIALLLERHRVTMLQEGRQRRLLALDQSELFLGPDALAARLAQAEGALIYGAGVRLVALRLRRTSVIATFWGPEAEHHVMASLHRRLRQILPEGTMMGLVRDDLILMCLPVLTGGDGDSLLGDLRHAVCARPVEVPGMAAVRIRMTLSSRTMARVPTLGQAMTAFAAGRLPWQQNHRVMVHTGGLHVPETGAGRLFRIADRMFESQSAGLSGRRTDLA
ncbi:MAG: LytS/YhcK type 5TM receptor domain-containing protein [Jannaschia sp.]